MESSRSLEAPSTDAHLPLLLLDCLHPSVFANNAEGAERVDAQRCLRIILKLLANHQQHPADPSFSSFSAVSNAWQNSVCPCVYVLRLVAWMGCVPDAEGERYTFQDTRCGEEEEHLSPALEDRIEELRCVQAVWATSIASLSTITTRVTGGAERDSAPLVSGEDDTSLVAAREALVQLYATAHGSLTTLQEDTAQACTRALQLDLLSRAASVREEEAAATASSAGHRTPNLPFTSPSAFVTSAEGDTNGKELIEWLLRHTSLCELTRECARAAAAAAAASPVASPSPSSSPSSSSVLAERFRKQACTEQRQRYLASTGPAYRRLSQEARHRGESVVIDIAALLEQIAVVTEAQGMVRTDRQEARRLLDTFKQDGDLVALYALQEQYTAELEEAKKVYNKPLVYAEYE